MTDQQDRHVDLTNNSLDVLTVAAGETAQRVRRRWDQPCLHTSLHRRNGSARIWWRESGTGDVVRAEQVYVALCR
jgi:hypothetical protein